MDRKKFVATFLSCMLLFSWSLVPAGAAEIPGSHIVMPRVAGKTYFAYHTTVFRC